MMMRTLILFCTGFVGTFLALLVRRKYLEFKDAIANMDNDINTATNAAHNALNIAADNRINIEAHHAEWRELHARNAQKCISHLKDTSNEIDKRIKAFESKLIDHDQAIAQQFSEVYEYIERCKKDNSFFDEVVRKTPKPKKEKKCTDI